MFRESSSPRRAWIEMHENKFVLDKFAVVLPTEGVD